MKTLDDSPLGKATEYPERYDPSLLFTVARAEQREAFGLRGPLPFSGIDLWTAYEITWLDPRGKPQVAIGELRIPADSPRIVESKSLKLYLGSFAGETAQGDDIARRIETDLARVCGAPVSVALAAPASARQRADELPGESLDDIDVATDLYEPEPNLLSAGGGAVGGEVAPAVFSPPFPV